MKEDASSVIEADLQVFCPQASEDKAAAIKQLVATLGSNNDASIQKISFKKIFDVIVVLTLLHCSCVSV